MRIQNVTSLDRPELHPFRTLRRPADHLKRGFFVAEGERVFDRLLSSDYPVISALLTPEWLAVKRTMLESRSPAIDVYIAPKSLLEQIVGHNVHQGIMALGKVPSQTTLSEILTSAVRPLLLLAIDDLVSAENVGVIVRNAHAFGVSALIVGETSSSPFLRRAVRNSMGSVFSVPTVHSTDLAQTLTTLTKDAGVSVLAVESGRGGMPLFSADLKGDVCLVVGGEGNGIRAGVHGVCAGTIEIPMARGIDSLNVANATAVCLYEVQRQRDAV